MNPIISGFATGAILAFRGGWAMCLKNGLIGAGFLAVMEGTGIIMAYMQMRAQQNAMNQMRASQQGQYARPRGLFESDYQDENELK